MDTNGRMITFQSKYGQKRQTFTAFQVKPYYRKYFENVFAFNSHLSVISIVAEDNFTEVIKPHDPKTFQFNNEKTKEIAGVLAR